MQNSITKTLGLQKSRYLVGKSLGKHTWVHVSALNTIEHEFKSIILSVTNSDYCVVRLEKDSSSFQLSLCRNFDAQREPVITGHRTYDIINSKAHLLKEVVYKSENPLVFHHKHLFVSYDYKGFDVKSAVDWSLYWKSKLPSKREISSRIGRVKGWNKILSDYGLLADTIRNY